MIEQLKARVQQRAIELQLPPIDRQDRWCIASRSWKSLHHLWCIHLAQVSFITRILSD